MSHNHDERVGKQLEAIKAGGGQLVVMVRQRIAMALDSLDAGDFVNTGEHLQTARSFVGPLANAQQYIAIADSSRLIHASEVEVGMELTHLGEVTAKEVESCPHCRLHIGLHIGEHELSFHGDQEVYVANPA